MMHVAVGSSNNLAWITDDSGIIWNITLYYNSCSYYAITANFRSGKNNCTSTYERIFSNINR